jgi:GTP-binding protein
MVLRVPLGTVAYDDGTGETIGELLDEGDRLVVAEGGRGGRGNARFKTSTHQAPREWEPGQQGTERRVRLELKLIADVGVVGEPNAGKSTFLATVTAARPKVADYPFTTLEPKLGVVELSDFRSFVVADIPGIIEGAHEGKGLGHQFLRHIERTRVLLMMVPVDSPDAQAELDLLRSELAAYSQGLAALPFVVGVSKTDLLASGDPVPEPVAEGALGTYAFSSATGRGLEELLEVLWRTSRQAEGEAAGEDGEEEWWMP